jgi:predicted Zn-dependent protease
MIRWAAWLFVTAAACGQVPSEKERAIGRGLAADVERQWSLLEDAQVTEYIHTLTGKLEPGFPMQVRLIDRAEPKAIAIPGGYLYISSGLIVRAQTEAEFAGVLAHGVAHIKHVTPITSRAGIPTIFMGDSGLCARFSDTMLLPVAYLPTQRGFEREADLLGIQYLSNAGFDPRGLVDFFERIKLDDGVTEDARAKAAEFSAARQNYIVTSSQFVEAQARINALSPPRRNIPPTLLP